MWVQPVYCISAWILSCEILISGSNENLPPSPIFYCFLKININAITIYMENNLNIKKKSWYFIVIIFINEQSKIDFNKYCTKQVILRVS